ncbi:MAG: hypothetical protein H7332_00065 [Bdellovibrionales bacterium]|nr:hypothetical protein [Ramlibacter sp.]
MNNLTIARAYGPDLFATSNRAGASKDVQAGDPTYASDLKHLAVTIISAAQSKGAGPIDPCAADAISILINFATRTDDVGKRAQTVLIDLHARKDCASVTPDLQQAARDMCQIVKDVPKPYDAPQLSEVVALFGKKIAGDGDLGIFLDHHIARLNDYPNAAEQPDQLNNQIFGEPVSSLDNKHDVPAPQVSEIGFQVVTTIRLPYEHIQLLGDPVRLDSQSAGTQIEAQKTRAGNLALDSQRPAAFLLCNCSEPGQEKWHALIAEPMDGGGVHWHFLTPHAEDAAQNDADGTRTQFMGHGDSLLSVKSILKAINDNPTDRRGVGVVIAEHLASKDVLPVTVHVERPVALPVAPVSAAQAATALVNLKQFGRTLGLEVSPVPGKLAFRSMFDKIQVAREQGARGATLALNREAKNLHSVIRGFEMQRVSTRRLHAEQMGDVSLAEAILDGPDQFLKDCHRLAMEMHKYASPSQTLISMQNLRTAAINFLASRANLVEKVGAEIKLLEDRESKDSLMKLNVEGLNGHLYTAVVSLAEQVAADPQTAAAYFQALPGLSGAAWLKQ